MLRRVGSPAAEVETDEDGVRALLAEQHPDLANRPLKRLGEGWDNTLWRLGDDLLVRLPRRAMSAPLALHEQRWLGELAARLPLPIPAPVRMGRPSGDYPWHWSVVPWINGVPGDRAPLTNPADAASRLGSFLRALHREAPADAPHNPYRGVPLSDRAARYTDALADLATTIDSSATERVWESALTADPWTEPRVWLHGDLHPANVLVEGGTLVGIVDFGDVCGGDPATDIAGAWMLLPAMAMPNFIESYGPVERHLERRSLGWAVLFALMLIQIGRDDPRPRYEAVGRATLDRAIERTGQTAG